MDQLPAEVMIRSPQAGLYQAETLHESDWVQNRFLKVD